MGDPIDQVIDWQLRSRWHEGLWLFRLRGVSNFQSAWTESTERGVGAVHRRRLALPDSFEDKLVGAIDRKYHRVMDQRRAPKIDFSMSPKEGVPQHGLTLAEGEIVTLIESGLMPRDIAALLNKSRSCIYQALYTVRKKGIKI